MNNESVVGGRNPVIEILKSGERSVEKLYVAQGDSKGSIKKILGMAKDKGIKIDYVSREKLDEISEGTSHQGVVAIVSPYIYKNIEDIFALAESKGEDPFVIVLDNLEDTHNFGAIIRTAECAGAHGIIIPKRRSVGVTPSVVKSSVGAVEFMNIVKVVNITAAIEDLKEKGVWVYGADMSGEDYYDANLTGPIALVIGSEGKGVSRLVKEHCDGLIKIPMKGKISSLNASVASGILTYEVIRQRAKEN